MIDDHYYIHVGYEWDFFPMERGVSYEAWELQTLPCWLTPLPCAHVERSMIVARGTVTVFA